MSEPEALGGERRHRIERRPVCGMRIERTGQASVARADVT